MSHLYCKQWFCSMQYRDSPIQNPTNSIIWINHQIFDLITNNSTYTQYIAPVYIGSLQHKCMHRHRHIYTQIEVTYYNLIRYHSKTMSRLLARLSKICCSLCLINSHTTCSSWMQQMWNCLQVVSYHIKYTVNSTVGPPLSEHVDTKSS